ncbi:hypothetical protein ScPMuIL_008483 [Solemya velum]
MSVAGLRNNLTRSLLLLTRSNIRHKSYTGYEGADKAIYAVTGGRINRWIQAYEDMVGLTEVKDAQGNVLQAETKFHDVQEKRRTMQEKLSQVQARLKGVVMELDKTNRGTDRYVELVTKENHIIREENDVAEALQVLDQTERETFSALSSAVRDSHEKERARAERTKYWSIIGSIIGAAIGITGTTINNYLRMKELRSIVSTSAGTSEDYKQVASELSGVLKNQCGKLETFLSDLRTMSGNEKSLLRTTKRQHAAGEAISDLQIQQMLAIIKQQESTLDSEIRDIKAVLGIAKASDVPGNIVYVGPRVETMLNDTQRNLEWKMKLNSLATVTFLYGAIAITVPIIYSIFRGS